VNYVGESLISGEILRYERQLHWSVLIVPYMIAFGCLVAGVICIINSIGPRLTLAAVLVLSAAHVIALAYASRNASEFAITNRRLIIKVGILKERSLEIFLNDIESIGVTQDVLGRVMGYGTIVVKGNAGTAESFDRVPQPVELRTQVQQQKDRFSFPGVARERLLGERPPRYHSPSHS
jgi:uncharacterized membrane protein YdbT with pleckstrin-like domain